MKGKGKTNDLDDNDDGDDAVFKMESLVFTISLIASIPDGNKSGKFPTGRSNE